ncbi:helix-turn-helix domain-containing protein [Streptomyces sp. NPDC052013]|uniref:transcriptional regulator n=1 Tax=Streptomyces sp. NPDC052013 TaxID=3365679 RepID=UPI0037D71C2D
MTVSAQGGGQDEVAGFAALLRELKERTDRSYGSLARRLGMNTSTLHRYCAGEAVPLDFAPAERFAALCGATTEERLELHRRWLLATAARQRPRGGKPSESPAAPAGRQRPTAASPDTTDAMTNARARVGQSTDASAKARVEPVTEPDGPGSKDEPAAGPAASAAQPDERLPRPAPAPGADGAARTAPAPDGHPAPAGHAHGGSGPASPPDGTGRPPGEADHSRSLAGTAPDENSPADEHAPTGAPGRPTRGDEPGEPRGSTRSTGRAGDSGDSGDSGVGGGAVLDGVVRGPVGASGRWQEVVGAGSAGGGGAGRRWYRRKRVVLAVGCVVLAVVGSLSALPDGGRQRPAADGVRVTAGPTASVSGSAGRRGASSSPSASGSPRPHGTDGSGGPAGPRAASSAPGTGPGTATSGPGAGPAGTPLAWTVDSQVWEGGCGHDYVVGKPPAQVPPPPAPQDAGAWAATQGAVHGRETLVEVSVQGKSEAAVVLTALRVRVAGRAEPVAGNAYAMDQGCGGSLTPRSFDVDLDKDRPSHARSPGTTRGRRSRPCACPTGSPRRTRRSCW